MGEKEAWGKSWRIAFCYLAHRLLPNQSNHIPVVWYSREGPGGTPKGARKGTVSRPPSSPGVTEDNTNAWKPETADLTRSTCREANKAQRSSEICTYAVREPGLPPL